MTAFKPQKTYLKLISLGPKSALAERGKLALSGPFLWRWKDHIDQKFMNMVNNLPKMTPPVAPDQAALGLSDMLAEKPLCGGCGAKVGPGVLNAGLCQLPLPSRADVISGPGDDAAVLEIGGLRQVLTTDHLRAVTDDPAAQTTAEADAPPAVSVVALHSKAREIDSAVILRGETEASRQVEVRAETSGRVVSAPLRKGAFVSEGQELCRIDAGTRAATVSEAEARLAEARLNETAASKLGQDGFASETRIAGSKAVLTSAETALANARRDTRRGLCGRPTTR